MVDDSHLDRHAVQVDHAPRRVRCAGCSHALVEAVDVVVQSAASLAHEADAVALLQQEHRRNAANSGWFVVLGCHVIADRQLVEIEVAILASRSFPVRQNTTATHHDRATCERV